MFKIILIIFSKLFQIYSETNLELELIQNISTSFEKKYFFIIIGFEKQVTTDAILKLSNAGYQTGVYNDLLNDKLPSSEPKNHLIFILNFNSVTGKNFLTHANNTDLLDYPSKWLIINSNNYYHQHNYSSIQIANTFSKFKILVDSEIFFAIKDDEFNYLIIKLYKLTIFDSTVIIETFGKFSKNNGLQITQTNIITAIRRKNLMKTMLRTSIVVTHNDTFKHLMDYRDKHIDSITKVNYILVQHLADIVNASLNYTIQSTWGYKTNTSTWTGMIGDLTEDRADIGGTPLFVTSDRVIIIDYIAMTTATRSYFVFRQPKLSYVTNVFTLPFDKTVWLLSFVLVVITTAGLFIMLKWEQRTKKTDLDPKDAVVVTIGAVCQQGASQVPELSSGRILTLFIFVSLMFLYTSYSANIVALLQSSSNSIKTLEDLLNSRLALGVDDTVFNRFYFPAADEPIRKAIYEKKVAPNNQPPKFMPIEEGIKKLRQGLFAFHVEGGSGYKLISETFYEDEKCDLEEISFLQVPDPWLAIQKNSSYKEMLKIGLQKIQESGIQEREVSKIYTKKPKCHGSGSNFVSVSLIDIYFAIVVFGSGLLISFLIFFIEIIVHKKIHNKYRKERKNEIIMKEIKQNIKI